MLDWFLDLFKVGSWQELVWIAVGLGGQLMFSMRFLLQWIVSERARRSVIPEMFWYFSMAGGLTLFAYAIHREDPVFIIGQATGVFIYARNIWLIRNEKRARQAADIPELPRAQRR